MADSGRLVWSGLGLVVVGRLTCSTSRTRTKAPPLTLPLMSPLCGTTAPRTTTGGRPLRSAHTPPPPAPSFLSYKRIRHEGDQIKSITRLRVHVWVRSSLPASLFSQAFTLSTLTHCTQIHLTLLIYSTRRITKQRVLPLPLPLPPPQCCFSDSGHPAQLAHLRPGHVEQWVLGREPPRRRPVPPPPSCE